MVKFRAVLIFRMEIFGNGVNGDVRECESEHSLELFQKIVTTELGGACNAFGLDSNIFSESAQVCRHCGGGDGKPGGPIACLSLDCSLFFERRKVQGEARAAALAANGMKLYIEPFY